MNIFLKYIKDGKKLDMLLSNIGGPQQSMSCAIKKKVNFWFHYNQY